MSDVDLTVRKSPVDLVRYSEKIRIYLAGRADHATIQRLRRNRQLTPQDLEQLELLLLESGAGSKEDLDRAAAGGVGYFARSLVGLEPDAVKDAMAAFIAGGTLAAAQLDFVNLIVQHLTRNGVMEIGQLYGSPFNSLAPAGPEQLFQETELAELDAVLKHFTAMTRVG